LADVRERMNKQLRILKGLHHDAAVALAQQERHLIGSDALCSVMLCDPGVMPRHCVIATDDYGMTCRSIDGAVTIDGRQIKPGETSSIDDFALIECGTAVLSIGPTDGDWSPASRALQAQTAKRRSTMRSLQRLNPYALFAVVVIGIAAVIGVAYAALSGGGADLAADRVAAARSWLADIAPPGSELAVGVDGAPGRELVLSGYVRSARQVRALANASKSFRGGMRLDLYVIEDMLTAMSRTAQRVGVECEPLYKSFGHLACSKAAASESVAAKLRSAARDVPGLRSLDVLVDAPPPAVVASAPPPSDGPPRLTQKFSVLMFRNERFLIGPYGERYREGDQFDGFKVERIEVDKITFAHDGRQFEFHVAALRTASR
jgi:hypothetical protein